jgi:hypothetical protein
VDIIAADFPPILALLPVYTLDEAKAGLAAIEAVRQKSSPALLATPKPPNADAALAQRVAAALGGSPMNRPKAMVLSMLAAAAPGEWVLYPEMKAAFLADGMEPERAAAALRDISWQLGAYLPASDTAAFARKIEVMTERSRAGGVYRYRLRPAFREAVAGFLADQPG